METTQNGTLGFVRTGSMDLRAMRQPDGEVWYWREQGWSRAVPGGALANSFRADD